MALTDEFKAELKEKIKDRTKELLLKGMIPSRILDFLAPDYVVSPNAFIARTELREWVHETAKSMAVTDKNIQRNRHISLGLAINWMSQAVEKALLEGKPREIREAIRDYCRLTGNGEVFDKKNGLNLSVMSQGPTQVVAGEQLKNLTNADLDRLAPELPAIMYADEMDEAIEEISNDE